MCSVMSTSHTNKMNNFKNVFLGFSDSDTEADRNPKLFKKSFFDPDNYLEFKNVCCKHKEYDSINPVDLLEKMFNAGYIGQHRNKTRKDYTVFKYRNPREVFVEEDECIIHRGLMRSLTIV